jgi:hypothetical protein
MCTIAQTLPGETGTMVQRHRPSAQTRDHMLLLIGALVSLSAMVILSRVRRAFDVAKLGWMSPQWLASYRASHP